MFSRRPSCCPRSGIDLWFSDTDVAFLEDPFGSFKRDCDFEFQEEHIFLHTTRDPHWQATHQGNTGFMLIRSSRRVQHFLSAVERACAARPEDDDQTHFFEELWRHSAMQRAVWYPHTHPQMERLTRVEIDGGGDDVVPQLQD